jgi:hypothetical protein
MPSLALAGRHSVNKQKGASKQAPFALYVSEKSSPLGIEQSGKMFNMLLLIFKVPSAGGREKVQN